MSQVSIAQVGAIVLDVLKERPGKWLTARDILGVCEGLAGEGAKGSEQDLQRVNRALAWLRVSTSEPYVHMRRSRLHGRPWEYMVEASK